MTTRRRTLLEGSVGVLAALVTVSVAELVAAIIAPASSPVLAVGSLVIDLSPQWLKEGVIALFGTADKVVLLVCIGVLVLALAVIAGVLEVRRRPWGRVVLVVVAAIALGAVATRAGANIVWVIPTIIGVVAGVVMLDLAARRLQDWFADAAAPERTDHATVSRRNFLAVLGGTAAASLVVGIAARGLSAASNAVEAVRQAIALPKAAKPAPPLPVGADLDIDGLDSLVSPNDRFYRIDTALQVPVIDAANWSLRITGLVEREVTITYDELLALPLTEHYVTLMCVSNEVGGSLVGNALWLGYPIRELLAKASPLPGADMVLSRSQDGFTASSPLAVLQESTRESLLAVGMNGEPLPLEHGFPVRMVVPGLYGYVSATKWVVELKVSRFADETAYWTDRGWSAEGPVKTSSRIDVPRQGSRVRPGAVTIAGYAWAQHTGITGVEVRVDKGPWQQATVATPISTDTWVQWVFEWDADSSGTHIIESRATDASGGVQSGTRVAVAPNGAEGWHAVIVAVE